MKLSARNQFPGTVVSVKKGPTSTSVKLEIADGLHITSIITTEAATELKLKKGMKAVAIIKAPSVILGVE
jgi:molybdopterin-binding protein